MVRTIEVIVDKQYKLTIDAETSINIVKQISDIRDFSKRSNPYTQSFDIPADSNNNKIFKHYNSLNDFEGYKTGKKVDVSILESGKSFFDGYIQMNSSTDVNGKSKYEVTCYNSLGNVIDNSSSLKDLDLSEFDHIFNYENMRGSWDDFIYRNGVRYPFSKGLGYVYPYNDYVSTSGIYSNRVSDTKLKTEFFKPHVYAKTIWDKIYSNLGLSYRSDFLNSPRFESLIITPDFNGLRVDDTDMLTFNVGRISTQQIVTREDWMFYNPTLHGGGPITTANYIVDWNREESVTIDSVVHDFFDPGDHYNAATFRYIVPNKTVQDINVKVFMKAILSVYQDEYGTTIPEGEYPYKTFQDGDVTYYAYLNLSRGGVTTTIDSNSFNIPVALRSATNRFELVTQEIPLSVASYQFLAGDQISIRVAARYNIRSWISRDRYDPLASYDRDFEVKTRARLQVLPVSTFGNRILNEFIQAGDPVKINEIIPDITQSDFIKSITKMFNLYIYPDPADIYTHIIEPYDQFFGQDGNISDWSKKIDRKSERKKEPLDDVSSKNILLTYTEDSDYLNEKYQDKYNEIFGQYLIEFDNDFKTGTTEERLKFAPTPLINEVNTDKIMTKIYKINSSSKEVEYTSNNKPRILYYNLLPCDSYLITDDVDGDFLQSSYPYSGFLDNPFDPEIDLNFFVAKEYYHTYNEIPLNNLYNLYWSNYYNNINSAPSLITGYFNLSSKDLYEFNFRDLIFLDGNYYIVNKLEYNITNPSLTKVELITSNFNSLKDKSINRNVEQFSTFGTQRIGFNGFVDGRRLGSQRWPITRSNSTNLEYIEANNGLIGRANILSTRSNRNLVYGDTNMVSGNHNIVTGESNELNNISEMFYSGNNGLIETAFNKSVWIGDGSSASNYGDKSLLVGDRNYYENTQQSLVIGDDVRLFNSQLGNIVMGNGFTVSATTSNSIIFGNTMSVKTIPFDDLYEVVQNGPIDITGTPNYIPVFTATASLTASNLYFTGSSVTNGYFRLTDVGQLILGSQSLPYGPATEQILSVISGTQTAINFQSTSSGDEIATINFDNGGNWNQIMAKKYDFALLAYSNFRVNVNGVDSIIVDSGPRVGVGEVVSDTSFNIKDTNVGGNIFRITSTSSTTLYTYNNVGDSTTVGDVEITATASNFIAKSPDGTRWRILIDNSGNLSTVLA